MTEFRVLGEKRVSHTHLFKHRVQPFILEGHSDFEQVHNDPEHKFSIT